MWHRWTTLNGWFRLGRHCIHCGAWEALGQRASAIAELDEVFQSLARLDAADFKDDIKMRPYRERARKAGAILAKPCAFDSPFDGTHIELNAHLKQLSAELMRGLHEQVSAGQAPPIPEQPCHICGRLTAFRTFRYGNACCVEHMHRGPFKAIKNPFYPAVGFSYAEGRRMRTYSFMIARLGTMRPGKRGGAFAKMQLSRQPKR